MTLQLLQEIIAVANEIQQTCDISPTNIPIAADPSTSQNSDLCQPEFESFSYSFKDLGISRDLKKNLEAIFQNGLKKLKNSYAAEVQKANFIFVGRNCKEEGQKFLEVLRKSMLEEGNKLHDTLMQAVMAKIKHFESEIVTQTDIESSSESSVAQKGHSPRAIAILEKVFSQTTNINRSEKLQLAKASKLEPRQVTIWVSITFRTRYL